MRQVFKCQVCNELFTCSSQCKPQFNIYEIPYCRCDMHTGFKPLKVKDKCKVRKATERERVLFNLFK
uniref:Uncharacterized protein n=1 Tax=viral metagenome TaxID=1070528 RepID=A0A6H2A0B3_9ZZZZ